MAFLVLIETSGNQNYIFATNKLRENVGASELTYRVGTQWVLQAVADAGGPKGLWAEDPGQLRQNLCDATKNLPLSEATKVEVIIATSGKALLLVHQRATGQAIIQQVTKTALELAPGIDVCGVISKSFELNKEPLGKVVREVHDQIEEVRANRPGPALRFLRLPIVTECATSGLPAQKWHIPEEGDGIEPAARSAVTLAKWEFRTHYTDRMDALLLRHSLEVKFAKNIDPLVKQLEEETAWLAVIHADGNGLGQIFLDFDKHAKCDKPDANGSYKDANEKLIKDLKHFSVALDLCTERAFVTVLKNWVEKNGWLKQDKKGKFRLPLLPIVMGGDDLTVIGEGEAALQFTHDFLQTFETETRQTDAEHFNGIIPEIAKEALGNGRLSACAGIAIVKPHYPFSAAYDLAEELIKSAKQVKKIVLSPKQDVNKQHVPWPCSALDFHALYDSTTSALGEIRSKLVTSGEQTKLYARPYVVTSKDDLKGAKAGEPWALQHHWCELQERVKATLEEDDDGDRVIPNSQLHDLRAGLFLGKDGANVRYDLIRHRYAADKAATLETFAEESSGELFFLDENHRGEKFPATKFLDAMEAANFWVKEEKGEAECQGNQ